jgi:hypothetical protein
MSALYALLSFLAAVAAVAAGYRVWERRSTTPSSGENTPSESTTSLLEEASTSAVATESLPSSPEAVPEIARSEFSQDLTSVASAPKAKLAVSPPIPDPWLEEPPEDGAEPAIPTSSIEPVISSPEPLADSPLASPGSANQSNTAATAVEADLSAKILRLGKSGQINQVIYLTRYANHTDSRVRSAVAKALGNLAINWRGTIVESMIPVLGRLSQDSKSEVRLAAVESLGKIQSNKVLPWLQRAQRYSDGSARKAATTALQRLKLNYYPKPTLALKPKIEKAQGRKRS